MSKLQLGFHGTFALKKEDIIKILSAASEEIGLNDSLENLMTRTGLGNKKVGPMKSWAIRAGLINDVNLTSEGQIVWKHDSRLEKLETDWFMHFYLSFGSYGIKPLPENHAEWGGWTYFIYSFLPKYKIFTLEELVESSLPFFEEERENLLKNFRLLLRAYVEKKALCECGLIYEKEQKYWSKNPQLPNTYIIAFFLAKIWERDFNQLTSIFASDLTNKNTGILEVLAVDTEKFQEILNLLEGHGVIEQRRTVPPYQIVSRWNNSLELLEKAYVNE